MKKILMTIFMLMTIPAYASTMCVENDVVAVVLDPTINGDSYTYSAANNTWVTSFAYGDIRGDSLCSSTSGSYANTGTPDETGGDRYCWCRSTHPVASLWVFYYDYGSSGNCAFNCASYCGSTVRYRAEFRAAMFGSVAQ